MGEFIQFTLNGLMSGAIYALIAVGIVSVFKATKVVNFAHGYIIMFGAYFYFTFSVIVPGAAWAPDWLQSWEPAWMVAMKADLPMFSPMGAVLDWLSNLPRIILGLAGAVICNALLGLLIERTLMRPLIGQSTFAMIMITVGLISVLSGTKGLIWTADAEFVPHIAPNTPIRLNLFDTPIFLFGADLVNVAVALLLFGAIVAMVRYTKSGVAIRATAEDQSTAYSMGISVPRVFSRAWVLAATTGAIAGAILATRNGVSPSLGLFGFSVLAIVLMGGLDSYVGVFIAALTVGFLEAMAQWQFGGEFAEVVPYIAVLVVILIRPHGLFGQKEVERI
ncbi:branched-chain amino acid ABC transporter permease [Oceaniradius stylonematis]|jgi:branched-chain amino acid transport system permease protein|uniref:Branched-chain amino acid ABC transporter permease n=1 Tax=Oceaniradius stylonematis TaxID=2184161 RepID=A0A3A8AFC5_9HYPH|nr:branched-chain amino acid ABC transporter permease [Oceaniradius stylonematis]RKF07759.1 branched-chain amino acid ABC transporter permease [Oceaniradius stylonematis]RNC95885.1 MAG: branched-chain amino acid ABC transporter permease [Oricola sp.]